MTSASEELIAMIREATENPAKSEDILAKFASIYAVWREELSPTAPAFEEEADLNHDDMQADDSGIDLVMRIRLEYRISDPARLVSEVEAEFEEYGISPPHALQLMATELMEPDLVDLAPSVGYVSAYFVDVRAEQGQGLATLDQAEWPDDPFQLPH